MLYIVSSWGTCNIVVEKSFFHLKIQMQSWWLQMPSTSGENLKRRPRSSIWKNVIQENFFRSGLRSSVPSELKAHCYRHYLTEILFVVKVCLSVYEEFVAPYVIVGIVVVLLNFEWVIDTRSVPVAISIHIILWFYDLVRFQYRVLLFSDQCCCQVTLGKLFLVLDQASVEFAVRFGFESC